MVASMKIALLVLVIVAVVAAHDSYRNRRCRTPSRGRYSTYTLYNNKRSVRYRCKSGYVKLRGYERHACYNGRWYPGTALVCQRRRSGSTRRCGKPPGVAGARYRLGYYSDSGNRYQYARYTCDNGYYLRSGYQSVRIICKFGKWAPSRPESCYPIAGRISRPFIPGNPYGLNNVNRHGTNNGYPIGPNSYNPYNPGYNPNNINQYNPYNRNPYNPNTINPLSPNTLNPYNRNPYNPNTINPLGHNTLNPYNRNPYNPNTINPLVPNTLNPYNPNIVNPYNPNTINPLSTNNINPYNPNNVNRLTPGYPSINRLGVDNPINPINTVNPLSVNLPNQVPTNTVHQGHIG